MNNHNFTNITWMSTAIFTLAVVIQLFRVFHGIEFNDEMQYYGELISLLDSGRLFSTDLFLQQNVYLLLYPIFKPYTLLFGNESLILASRFVFATFILWVFWRVKSTLIFGDVKPVAANVIALTIILVIPLANIYALSYNTISQGLLAVCFAELFVWRYNKRVPKVLFWAVAILLLLLTYPTMGLAVAATFILRLLVDGDRQLITKFVVTALPLGLLALFTYFNFATIKDIEDSITFSRGFVLGAAGSFTASKEAALTHIGYIIAGLVINHLLSQRFIADLDRRLPLINNIYFILATFVVIVFLVNVVFPVYRPLVIISFLFSLFVVDGGRRPAWFWVSILFLISSTTMGLTSGNGFSQSVWPAMIAAPFFIAFALTKPVIKSQHIIYNSRNLAAILGLVVLYNYGSWFFTVPYKDDVLWHQHAVVNDAPVFANIRMTQNKADAIDAIKTLLSDVPDNSRVMILGSQPWIYFAINSRPDTDMIFMHNMGGPSQGMVAKRLLLRHPEYVIIVGLSTLPIRLVIPQIINADEYSCVEKPNVPLLIKAKANIQSFFDMYPKLTICRALRPI